MSSVIRYDLWGVDWLAVIKNGFVIDIACSEKGKGLQLMRRPSYFISYWGIAPTKVKAKDLALYTHWPQHTKEFWDLLKMRR